MGLARSPALHFVVLGLLMFAIDRLEPFHQEGIGSSAPDAALVITAERISALARDWRSRTGLWPSPEATDALIQKEVDDELLVREARRLGFQRSDPIVRRRLTRNIGFALGESGEEAAFREALTLGMDRTDLVVRRRLIQKLELRAAAEARLAPVSDEDLLDYLQRHPSEFSRPASVWLAHVYFSRDRRGSHLEADAIALQEALRIGSVGPEHAAEFGDPFLHGNTLPPQSEAELALKFGRGFAREAMGLARGGWHGPIPSSHGSHLVWVRAHQPRRPAKLPGVRSAVREALLAERAELARSGLLARLRDAAPIRVESPIAAAAG